MKKSDEFIKESVFKVNMDFLRLENETKELFFRCLDEERSEEYFNEKLAEIWGNMDFLFMTSEINKYREIIHENNLEILEMEETDDTKIDKKKDTVRLATKAIIAGYVTKLVKQKKKEYKRTKKSPVYKLNKDVYLKEKVYKYNNKIVPYYKKVVSYNSRSTGEPIKYVDLNTYASMLHNTEMTKAGWEQTLEDGEKLGEEMFYIPVHNFSCPDCAEYQGIPMTRDEVYDLIGVEADEDVEEIFHPNCKCTIQLYTPLTEIRQQKYSPEEIEQQYEIRQKVNSLTLEKERIKTDSKIYERMKAYDEVDKLNQKRNSINEQIRELKNELPTKELQKQVVAINRNK